MSHATLPLEWDLWVGDIGSEMRMRIGGVTNLAPDANVEGRAWRKGAQGVDPEVLPATVLEVLDDGAIIAIDPDAWLADAAPGDWLVNAVVEGVTFPEGPAGKATVRRRSRA